MIKRKIISFLLLFISLISVLSINASSQTMSASGYIVYEGTSKRVIYEKNSENVFLTASICKILTCITAIEYGDINKWCFVTKECVNQEGSSIYLHVGDKIKLIDLLYGLMLRSGNDCAYLIAQSVFGYDKFISLMNEMAKKIGMTNSTFTNPSGLDDKTRNYSTPLDMAKLISYCSKNELYSKINSCKLYKSETFQKRPLIFTNKHKLISQNESDFLYLGKTGYTKSAKRTLVTCAKKDGLEVIVVTFCGGNDFNEHKQMIDYVFNNFARKVLIKSQIIDTSSDYPYIAYLKDDVYVILKEDETSDCKVIIELYPKCVDDICGYIKVYLNNEKIYDNYVYRYY